MSTLTSSLQQITVVGCQGLLNTDSEHVSDLTDPFVAVFQDNLPEPILITPMLINTLSPEYDAESASTDITICPGTVLTFQVWHQALNDREGRFLGECKITGDRILSQPRSRTIETLCARVKESNPLVKAASDGTNQTITLGSIMIEWCSSPDASGKDTIPENVGEPLGGISILRGGNLLRRDTAPTLLSDPKVKLMFPSRKSVLWTSTARACTLKPDWSNESLTTLLKGNPKSTMIIEVWNENPRPERDSFMGCVMIRPMDLDEGLQRLELTPRANEPDGLIKKLEGRLGWIEVEWKPLGELLTLCQERKRAKMFDGSGSASAVSQWTPTELNEYIKRLRGGGGGGDAAPLLGRPQPTAAAGAVAGGAAPPPSSSAVAVVDKTRSNSAPMPLHELSKFSPYYPHSNAQVLRSSAIRSAPMPPQQPTSEMQATTTSAPEDDQKKFVRASKATVDLTELIPVRVVYGGKYFDTELNMQEPLEKIQADAEDCFHVHKDVQLFSHNGELKDTRLSLLRNGCLLLKGDPHIKLTMSVSKGALRNIIVVFPDHREVPLAVAETNTVRTVKNQLIDEYGNERGLEDLLTDPKDLRLLWRHNELNDKATLQYYSIPINAKLHIVRRPKFSFAGTRASDDDRDDRFEQITATSRPSSMQPSYNNQKAVRADDRISPTYNTAYDDRRRSSPLSGRSSGAGGRGKESGFDESARRPPLSRAANGSSTRSNSGGNTKSAGKPRSSSARTTQREREEQQYQTHTTMNRPRGYYEVDQAGVIDDPELTALRKTIRDLEQQVRQQNSQRTAMQQDAQDKRMVKLERDFAESEERYRNAIQRIAELESTISRYQLLLQRATQLSTN